MKKTVCKLLRLTFVLSLTTAALFVSGGKNPSACITVAEKNRIKAAEAIVDGVSGNSDQWKTYAAVKPMLFIEIEAGNL